MQKQETITLIAQRFRKFLPVIIDIETGDLNPKTDALLEIAAVLLQMDSMGKIYPTQTYFTHIIPFPGSRIDPKALEINGIKDPYHPFRFAVPEVQGVEQIFQAIRNALTINQCQRAVLVGHNPNFDLSFLQAAMKRNPSLRSPFHRFTTFDTATLSGLAFGETILAKALVAADLEFDPNQAHSAVYDAERTAELFCLIVNRWEELGGWQF